MPTKRIVCLANSRKPSGRCIAGREINEGGVLGWVRPVSARLGEEVSLSERQYESGGDPEVLDVVEVPILEPKPKDCQQENWLLDPNTRWKRAGRLEWKGLLTLTEAPERLWVNESSTHAGLNDQISLESAKNLKSSLVLIHVNELHLHVLRWERDFGSPRLRVQGRFQHHVEHYWLWVTDPGFENT